METRTLYEETITNMLEMLQKTVNNFSAATDTVHDDFAALPLFYVISPSFALVEAIEYFSRYQAKKAMVSLCRKLCDHFGMETSDCICNDNVDFFIHKNGKKWGYSISYREDYMPSLEDSVADGMVAHYTVVLSTNLIVLPPNSFKYRNYPHKYLTSNITLKELFDQLWQGEYEVFKEYIGRFNYEAGLILGLSITPKPTQKALNGTWDKICKEFGKPDVCEALAQRFTKDEIEELQNRFLTNSILRISKAPYVDSFVSSEWYFDLLETTDVEMEQTAIVAGYLKSIEQLLFALMLSRSHELTFKLWSKENELLPLTVENRASLLTMAGSLIKSIEKNYGNRLHHVFCNATIGSKALEYLAEFFSNTRNGYFHKHNLHTKDQIKAIRKEAYCAYFLLGAAFVFSVDILESIEE